MQLPSIQIGRPQGIAILLLSAFVLQCLWLIAQQPINRTDYSYASCGREMWEHRPPLLGYYTSCGNIHDGVLAYRAASAPLSLAMTFDRQRRGAGVWEFGGSLSWTKWAIRLPFVLFGVWLGGALWWVTRRLFGAGGYVALALFCFSPHMIEASTRPSPEILAAWGLFGLVFTAIGVAHTLYAPRRKWYKRILLLGVALGVTAASHTAAALLGLLFAAAFMLYLAPKRRLPALVILAISCAIAVAFLSASYSFNQDAMSFWFHGRAAVMNFTLQPMWSFLTGLPNAAVSMFLLVALAGVCSLRRCRYFGNTAPLMIAVLLLMLRSAEGRSFPWLWALPFLFAFIGGVFADLLDLRQRKQFLAVTLLLLVTNVILCLMTLPAIAYGEVWTG